MNMTESEEYLWKNSQGTGDGGCLGNQKWKAGDQRQEGASFRL